ncbi:hypothetical protein [Nocardia farcinica]|uniref:hypothetical protein n=1 Tax=Nocardia farcinica TaxID=37329 RepID=UPI000DFB6CCA|nr:hypothetical protein [Nocardia farcinica]MBF6253643.1 hypothetical protein [Nocardia farcinica]SUE29558.1 Uncharacterised protein [Nocardia farcinica]
MKITALISELVTVLKTDGDLEVEIPDFGGCCASLADSEPIEDVFTQTDSDGSSIVRISPVKLDRDIVYKGFSARSALTDVTIRPR